MGALTGYVRAGSESNVHDGDGVTYTSLPVFRICLSAAAQVV